MKPSQLDPNKIADTGTGGLSEFQAAKNVKHISGVDYNYLISYFKGNTARAQDAVINLKENKLREMIDAQKGLAGKIRSQLNASSGIKESVSQDKANTDFSIEKLSDKAALSFLKWINKDTEKELDSKLPLIQDIKDLAKNYIAYQAELSEEHNLNKNPYTFLKDFSNGMLNSYVDRAETLDKEPQNLYNWANSLTFGYPDQLKETWSNQKERIDAVK